MDRLTDRKRKAKGGSRLGKGTPTKWTCAANKAGGTLSETLSTESTGGAGCWHLWASSGSGVRGKHLQREQQVDVWAVVSCVSAKASTSLSWSVINETVNGLHCSPPSSLPPGWPCNVGSKRRLSHYRRVYKTGSLRTQEKFLWWGGMIRHSCYGL